jgi:hypothetical protein
MSKARAIDKNGLEYKTLSETNEGDQVMVDDGFTCIKPLSKKVVKKDDSNCLYVDCDCGQHYLDGQYEDYNGSVEPFYIGLYKCY